MRWSLVSIKFRTLLTKHVIYADDAMLQRHAESDADLSAYLNAQFVLYNDRP